MSPSCETLAPTIERTAACSSRRRRHGSPLQAMGRSRRRRRARRARRHAVLVAILFVDGPVRPPICLFGLSAVELPVVLPRRARRGRARGPAPAAHCFASATPAPFRSRSSPAPNANSAPTALASSSTSICCRHLPRTGRRRSPICRSRRMITGPRAVTDGALSSALSHSRSGSRTPIAWRWSWVSRTYSALSPDWPLPART